jgi:hypothetical protein
VEADRDRVGAGFEDEALVPHTARSADPRPRLSYRGEEGPEMLANRARRGSVGFGYHFLVPSRGPRGVDAPS